MELFWMKLMGTSAIALVVSLMLCWLECHNEEGKLFQIACLSLFFSFVTLIVSAVAALWSL